MARLFVRSRFSYTLFWIILLHALFATGCVSKKAVGTTTSPDYNGRVAVKNARFEKRMGPGSIAVIGASTGIGGIWGYHSNLTGYYQDGERQTSKIGNAAIGALTGFGISYLVNRLILGDQETVGVTSQKEVDQWIRKKYSSKYQIIEFTSGRSDFRIIPRAREDRFAFRDRNDFFDFSKAFERVYLSNSFNTNVSSSLNGMRREDLVWLYRDDRRKRLTSTNLARLEDQIYARSTSIEQLGETAGLVPRFQTKARDDAYAKAYSISSLGTFSRSFPEWASKAETAALNKVTGISTAREFRNSFNSDRALVAHAEKKFSQGDLKKLSDLFEVPCASLSPGRSVQVSHYVPPGGFAVISLKNAPLNEIQVRSPDLSTWDYTQFEILQLKKTWFGDFLYATRMTQTYPSGKFFSLNLENYYSKSLRYCIHSIDLDDYGLSLERGLSFGGSELIRKYGGKYEFQLDVGKSALEAIYSGKNILKKILLDQFSGFIANELGFNMAQRYGSSVASDFIYDIFKNIP